MQNQNSTNIYKSQENNVFKTWIYLILFSLFVGFIGFLLATYFNNPLFFWLGSGVSISMSFYSYWFSDKAVLKMAGAKQIDNGEYLDIQNMVQKLVSNAGLPMPKIYTIEDPSPNAFATGRNPQNSAIAFTTGILTLLNKDELEAVTAHELSHVANRDTLIMAVVAVLASVVQTAANMIYFFSGRDHENKNIVASIIATVVIAILAPLAATIIQLAISRKREFLADASGAKLSNKAKELASALIKINKFPYGMQNVNPSIAHLFISTPERNDEAHRAPWYLKLFLTHPPVEDRVMALTGEKI